MRLDSYFGREYGIPEPVWITCKEVANCPDLKATKNPRHLIHGFNMNHELRITFKSIQQKWAMCWMFKIYILSLFSNLNKIIMK